MAPVHCIRILMWLTVFSLSPQNLHSLLSAHYQFLLYLVPMTSFCFDIFGSYDVILLRHIWFLWRYFALTYLILLWRFFFFLLWHILFRWRRFALTYFVPMTLFCFDIFGSYDVILLWHIWFLWRYFALTYLVLLWLFFLLWHILFLWRYFALTYLVPMTLFCFDIFGSLMAFLFALTYLVPMTLFCFDIFGSYDVILLWHIWFLWRYFALTYLVLMMLFCTAIKKSSVSILSLPFLVMPISSCVQFPVFHLTHPYSWGFSSLLLLRFRMYQNSCHFGQNSKTIDRHFTFVRRKRCFVFYTFITVYSLSKSIHCNPWGRFHHHF